MTSPFADKNWQRRQKLLKKKNRPIKEMHQEAKDVAKQAYDFDSQHNLLPEQVESEALTIWHQAKAMSSEELRATVRRGGGLGVHVLAELATTSTDQQVRAVASKSLVDAAVKMESVASDDDDTQAQALVRIERVIIDGHA